VAARSESAAECLVHRNVLKAAGKFSEVQILNLRVVLADGQEATETELIEHTRGQLAHYKCPTRIEFRAELARTATGKLQKYKLRAPYWEGHEKQVN